MEIITLNGYTELETGEEGIYPVKAEAYAGIYAEIVAQIDKNTAVKIHELLKGQMVCFPQKLYSREYVREFIREHYQEYSVRELSKMFDYSDRRIRQMIAEEKEK